MSLSLPLPPSLGPSTITPPREPRLDIIKYSLYGSLEIKHPRELEQLGITAIQEEDTAFLDRILSCDIGQNRINNLLCYAAGKGAPHVLEHLVKKYDVNCTGQVRGSSLTGSPIEVAQFFNNSTNMTILLNHGCDLGYVSKDITSTQVPTLLNLLRFRRHTHKAILPRHKLLVMQHELIDSLKCYLTEECIRLCLRAYLNKGGYGLESDYETILLLLHYYKDLNPDFEKLDAHKHKSDTTHKFSTTVTLLFLHQPVRDAFKDHPGYHAFLERQGITKVHLAAWDNDLKSLSQFVEEGGTLLTDEEKDPRYIKKLSTYYHKWRWSSGKPRMTRLPGRALKVLSPTEICIPAELECSPLSLASYNGSLDAVQLILSTGSVGQRDLAASLLHACKAGQLEVIKCLETHCISGDSAGYDLLLGVVLRYGNFHCMEHLVSKGAKAPFSLDWSQVRSVEAYNYIRKVMRKSPAFSKDHFRECFRTCPDDVLLLIIKDYSEANPFYKKKMGTLLRHAIKLKKGEAFINEILKRGPELTDGHVTCARRYGYPAIADTIQRRLHPEVVMIRA